MKLCISNFNSKFPFAVDITFDYIPKIDTERVENIKYYFKVD